MSRFANQGVAKSVTTGLAALRRDWLLRGGVLLASLAVVACFAAAFNSAEHRDDRLGANELVD